MKRFDWWLPVLLLVGMLYLAVNQFSHQNDDDLLVQLQQQLGNSWERQTSETLLVSEAIVAEEACKVAYLSGKRVDMADVLANVKNYTGRYIEFEGTVMAAAMDVNDHNPLSSVYSVSGELTLLAANGVRVKAYVGMLPGWMADVIPMPWRWTVECHQYVGRYVRCKGVVLDVVWFDDSTPALLFTGVVYQ